MEPAIPAGRRLVVPRGANVDYAMDLARYILAPENNAKLSQYIPYGPTNRESLSLVESAMRDHLPTSYMDLAIAFDNIWLNQNRDEVDSRWQSWVRAA